MQGDKARLEAAEARVKVLEKQRAELLEGFRKQMKLIDILKRQKVRWLVIMLCCGFYAHMVFVVLIALMWRLTERIVRLAWGIIDKVVLDVAHSLWLLQ